MAQHRRAGEDHRQRVGDVLALERRRRPCGASAITADARNSSSKAATATPPRRSTWEELEHHVREAVAVAVERRDDQGVAGAADQRGVEGVDQHRPVAAIRVAGGGRVELLLQHPLVDRRDGPLGPAEHRSACAGPGGRRTRRPPGRCGARCARRDRRPRRRRRPRGTRGRCRRRRPPSARSRSARGCLDRPHAGEPAAAADDDLAADGLAGRRAFGLPTSPAPSGVMVAAFRPKPWATTASA